MPLSGEYAPSPLDWSREQADTYMKSGGTEGTQLQGKPVILLTTVGAKTGKLRKTPLMRVEHWPVRDRRLAGWGAEKSGLVPQRREEPTGRAAGRHRDRRLRRPRGVR